jgi:PAS domain S-box-containing protein
MNRFQSNTKHVLAALIPICALLFSWSVRAATSKAPLPTVSTVQGYYDLSSEDARRGLPVRIEGVVIYSDSSWNLLWVRGESGVLFQAPPDGAILPAAGTRVIVTGTTLIAKKGAHGIEDLKLAEIGAGELRPPVILKPGNLNGDQLPNRRVMLGGTVVESRMEDGHLWLIVAFLRNFQVRVIVKDSTPEQRADLLGAQVEVVGWAAVISQERAMNESAIQVFVSAMSDLTVYRRGPRDVFDVPSIEILDLGSEYEKTPDPRLLRFRGEVAEQAEDSSFVLAQGTNRVPVLLRSRTKLVPGALVDVVGIVWRNSDSGYFIDHALLRPAQAGTETASRTEDELPILHTVQAVRGLTPEMAVRGYPVDISGTVTYYDPVWRILFLQDATGGIYVDAKSKSYPFVPGDRIQVRGVSDPGGFAPMIAGGIQLYKRSSGDLPVAREVSFGRLMSGAEDSQWVTLGGVVEAVSRSQKNLLLRLRNEAGPFEVVVLGEGPRVKNLNWVGAEVKLTGVCGIKANSFRQVTGINFHVPGTNFMEFTAAPPLDPFDIDAVRLADLLRFDLEAEPSTKRVKIAGVVTFSGGSGMAAIQDGSSGMLLRFPTNSIPARRDLVEILGFPYMSEFVPTLRELQWRKLGETNSPAALPLDIEHVLEGGQQARLVEVTATVMDNHAAAGTPLLTMESMGLFFSAEFPGHQSSAFLRGLRPRAVVRLVGVCCLEADAWDLPRTFKLLVSDESSVQVVREAPSFETDDAIAAVAGLLLIVVAALAWAGALRSRVAKQTERIREEMNARGHVSARYHDLIENAQEMIFSLDSAGAFTAVNPATEKVFCEPRGILLDSKIWPWLDPNGNAVLQQAIDWLHSGRAQTDLELQVSAGEGKKMLELGIRRQQRSDGQAEIQCIARDVSERRQIEGQMRQMQKMESIGQLAAGVAHDYNNLMTVVLTNTEFIQEDADLEGDNAVMVDEIQIAARRAADLTSQLLAFSRRQIMKVKVLDPTQLLAGLTGMLSRLIGENIELSIDVDEGLPTINGDRGMIEQVLVNLVLNARDAMSDGGKLTLAARAIDISEADADHRVEALPGLHLDISVTDTGIGIAPDQMGHLFEPFYTTKEVGEGTGLGLSTVFGIAKQHEGWVEVESAVGQGSVFHVYLPANIDMDAEDQVRANDNAGQYVGSETVLIVEDDEPVRQTMVKVLHRAGYRVLQAGDGPEALEVWKGNETRVSLLVSDMVMPGGMSGRDVANEIRKVNPDLLAIFCSGYSADFIGLSTLSDRERLLPKPFERKMLVKLARELLDSR